MKFNKTIISFVIVGYETGFSLFCQESHIIYLVIFNILLLLTAQLQE